MPCLVKWAQATFFQKLSMQFSIRQTELANPRNYYVARIFKSPSLLFLTLNTIFLLPDLCQGVKCRFGARCEAGECVCPTNCSYSEPSELVCASNMITYPNECEMQKASCDLPEPLSIIFFGDCREKFSVPYSKYFIFVR